MIGQGSASYRKSHSSGWGMTGMFGTFPPAVISSGFLALLNTSPHTDDVLVLIPLLYVTKLFSGS